MHMIRFSLTLSFTITLAVCCAFFLNDRKSESTVSALLQSRSSIDVLMGISLTKDLSFDTCKQLLIPLMQNHPEYLSACEEVLITVASSEIRHEELIALPISTDTKNALSWWVSRSQENNEQSIPIPSGSTPWLFRLTALQHDNVPPEQVKLLIDLPHHDRDGSVVLAALCIDKFIDEDNRKQVINQLLNSTDSDEVVTGLLLSSVSPEHQLKYDTHSGVTSAISNVIKTKDKILAWRMLHNPDGSINPNIMFLCLAISKDEFVNSLIESAMNEKWTHPEHPIELAKRFYPIQTHRLTKHGLSTVKSRQDWWQKFKCGYLIYQGLQNDKFNCP